MTKDEILRQVRAVACRLKRERGLSDDAACRIAARAGLRALGRPIPVGLGADPTSAAPAAPASQDLLQEVAAAGANPTVTEVRNAVTPWLWVLSVATAVKSFFGKR
jgi:hypothetical protein